MSCNPIGRSRNPLLPPESSQEPRNIPKFAANEDGVCTKYVLDDTEDLRRRAAKLLQAKDPEAIAKANAELTQFAGIYRATYGNFQCEFLEDGQRKKLDPTAFYLAIDESHAELEKSSTVAADHDCSEEFSAEFKAMSEKIKPHLENMSALLAAAMRKMASVDGAQAELAQIRMDASLTELSLSDFRSKHPGEFSCLVTDTDGTKFTTSSAEMDAQIQRLKKNFPPPK